MKKWLILSLIIILIVANGLIFTKRTTIAQDPLLPISTIWNNIYDSVSNTLNGADQAIAQDEILPVSTILNNLYVEGAQGPYLRVNSIASGAELPATCTPPAWFSSEVNQCIYNCTATDTWTPSAGCSAGGASDLSPGLTYNSSGIQGLRYDTLALSGTCTLGANTHVVITAGASGVTCTLPDPSLTTTRSEYIIDIVDANNVILAPLGTNLLNGVNAALTAVKGPLSRIHATRQSDTAWKATVVSGLGYGTPMANLCTSSGGNTNADDSGSGTWIPHTLTCTIPANAITTNSVINHCVGWRLVTAAIIPTIWHRLVANATVIWEQAGAATYGTINVAGQTGRQCFQILGSAVPSAASNIYVTVPTDLEHTQYPALTSIIGDPVAVATNGAIVLTWESKWTTNATGTNSIQQLTSTTEGARLAN